VLCLSSRNRNNMHTLPQRLRSPFRPALAYEVFSNVKRRQVLDHLRRHGASSIRSLAEDFQLSELRIRNHISLLHEAGLVRLRKGSEATIVHFSPVGWARLKNRWEAGMNNQLGLRSVG